MNEPQSYVGRCKCGAIQYAVANDDRNRVAECLAEIIQIGLIVEGVTDDEVRGGNWRCTCDEAIT